MEIEPNWFVNRFNENDPDCGYSFLFQFATELTVLASHPNSFIIKWFIPFFGGTKIVTVKLLRINIANHCYDREREEG